MTYLTVKALRHYHEIGLLEPVTVDDSNGYRMYDVDQVALAQTIRRFRELDMPTDDIRAVLGATDDDERNRVIVAHLDRMEERLQQTRDAVDGLRVLLADSEPLATVTYRRLVPILAIAIRENVSFEDAEQWCDAAYSELHALIDARGGSVDGADGALYEGEFFEQGSGEVTAFVPLAGDIPTSGRVVQTEIPGFDAAVAVHTGAFADLDYTYRALGTSVAEQGIGAPGAMREHYRADDTIEVCWPITALPTF
jgi:DNA-binding transcriptional MerR regulator